MGEKHTGTVAPADERSLVALPESEQLGTDGLATSFTIAASARLLIERVRVGSVEPHHVTMAEAAIRTCCD